MNNDWIRIHLSEALEELTHTIAEIEKQPDYDEAEFRVAMEHVYNHLNTAWNSRNADPQFSDENFYIWRAFPSDIAMGP